MTFKGLSCTEFTLKKSSVRYTQDHTEEHS